MYIHMRMLALALESPPFTCVALLPGRQACWVGVPGDLLGQGVARHAVEVGCVGADLNRHGWGRPAQQHTQWREMSTT